MNQIVPTLKDIARAPVKAWPPILRDQLPLSQKDAGAKAVIDASLNWLGAAQDESASQDGGAARDFDIRNGWSASYPETSGYIVPTLFDAAERLNRPDLEARARKMLDWLVSIQMDDGAFQGGRIDQEPVVPVTFNTGQILLGLAAGASRDDQYLAPMQRAADWLRDTLDEDGCWRKYPTPFAEPGEKVYETHVSWGLLEAARVAPENGYGEAALKNVDWAISHQNENGWFEKCCLDRPDAPLTHTIGYVLRGVIEAHRFSNDDKYLQSALLGASEIVRTMRPDGAIPGRLDSNWSGVVPWVCLTGNVQLAYVFFYLFEKTGDRAFLHAGLVANQYVRRTVELDGPKGTCGGVRGSFPVNGDYGKYQYLNWAAKFLVDSLFKELELAGS